MIVVGGTYDELCFEPRWEEKFGSGLRACRVMNALDKNLDVNFYTFGDKNTELYLKQVGDIFKKISSNVTSIDRSISFQYHYPLSIPQISPRLDTIERYANKIELSGDDILYYGFVEGSAKVTGKNVVYDPQSPSNPIAFSKTGSTAENLAVVVNMGEASLMAKSTSIEQIKNYFFDDEKASVLVVKMGAKGALVAENGGEDVLIPIYKTSSVWPIGSGDVFASSFAYYWFSGERPIEAAHLASQITASYCETRSFNFTSAIGSRSALSIENLPQGQIYLAGPFFTFAERWLVDQIRTSLRAFGLNVFSPWHDIGHGIAAEVVTRDLDGLNSSKLIFAILDGLDSGTLFEVGYAVAKGIPVIVYVENETAESVKMLEGTGCFFERDVTTAVYKSLWILSENE